MIVRQALYDRQSNHRYHTYPQVDFKKNNMGSVRRSFAHPRCGSIFQRDEDVHC
jgi:hypothetical protein